MTTINTDKFWLKHYPPNVPAEIDVTQYKSLVHLLEEAFKTFADRNAYVCMDKFLTYREVDVMSKKVGAWLQSRGLQRGARVAVMMPNVLQYPVVLAAILRAGYVVVNVNPLYTHRELEHQLKDSGAEAIFVLENFATTLEHSIANTDVKHVVVCAMGDLLGGLERYDRQFSSAPCEEIGARVFFARLVPLSMISSRKALR